MQCVELEVSGAFAFTPEIFPDERGRFVSPMQQAGLLGAAGLPAFPAAQTSYNVSRRGVVRGIHVTRTPPGGIKYVYSPHGRAMDMVVDLRLGSPTFGRWDSVILDPDEARGVYVPVGVGHAFAALADETIVTYLLSQAYDPANELTISVFDPVLGLPIPDDIDPIVSEKDGSALTVAQAEAAGLLTDYETCLAMAPAVASGSR